jgi:DNA repair exonuclease SbcCD nuclease subunit
MKNPTAILTGDWHLREDSPTCRTDDFWTTQWEKVDFVSDLQKKYNCQVIHSGDLFNHWKPSPYLLNKTMRHIPKEFYTVYGNHDLPQHNIELADKCGINVLHEAERLNVLNGTHWNQKPEVASLLFCPTGIEKRILVWHVMTFAGKEPWPGCPDPKSSTILKKYPDYNLIVTGHNHQTFISKYKNRILVNPGSLTRQTADQIDHQPCVFLWYADTNEIEEVLIPIKDNVISRDHIEKKKDHDTRIEAFVSRLNTEWEASISFEENLARLIKKNEIRQSVQQIIYQAVEP